MRKIIISFCILFAALSLQAQSVNGIRIDGGGWYDTYYGDERLPYGIVSGGYADP